MPASSIAIETESARWYYSAQAGLGLGHDGLFEHDAGTVRFSLVNDSAGTASKEAAICLSMFGDPGVLPAVPEPSKASLLLCGPMLCTMAARLRRRGARP